MARFSLKIFYVGPCPTYLFGRKPIIDGHVGKRCKDGRRSCGSTGTTQIGTDPNVFRNAHKDKLALTRCLGLKDIAQAFFTRTGNKGFKRVHRPKTKVCSTRFSPNR